jgi:hypothetical protein
MAEARGRGRTGDCRTGAGGIADRPPRARIRARAVPAHPPAEAGEARRFRREAARRNYLSELNALAAEGRLELTLTLTGDADDWSHARGRTGAAHLGELLEPATIAFVCGPPAMVLDVPTALSSLGLPRHQIVTEKLGGPVRSGQSSRDGAGSSETRAGTRKGLWERLAARLRLSADDDSSLRGCC